MPHTLPARIAIDHDDDHANLIGKTADGRQFFITEPFEPTTPAQPGNEFVALFLFDAEGRFLEAFIDAFGPRNTLDRAARDACVQRRLDQLGEARFGRIEIAPFQVERFGTQFGLIPNEPEDADDVLTISLMPGDFMALAAPGDSGEYDT